MDLFNFLYILSIAYIYSSTAGVLPESPSTPQQSTQQCGDPFLADSCYQLLNSQKIAIAMRDQGVIRLCQEAGLCGGYSCKLCFVCDGDHYRVAAIRDVKSFHAIYSNAIAENIDLLELQVNPHCGLAKEDTLVVPFRANLCIVN